ncbi:arginine deiminase-related protein [soil metagenome]
MRIVEFFGKPYEGILQFSKMKNSVQAAAAIWMIRPAFFGNNKETAASNSFQTILEADDEAIHHAGLEEFDRMLSGLKETGIRVIATASNDPLAPDAIFPNNWISFHEDGTIVIYPMMTSNRRREKNLELLEEIKQKFVVNQIHDLSVFENENKFLEGTGSMVLDHKNKIAYAAYSPRTDQEVFERFCTLMHYTPIGFHTRSKDGSPLYHTNVMMHIGETYIVVCADVISDSHEREQVVHSLKQSGRIVLEIDMEEMNQFAGNMLQVKNNDGDLITVISANAFDALSDDHLHTLMENTNLFPVPIPVIEAIGGGSVRCMMAEIFLPEIQS